jgi:hypothetical protein
MVHCNAIKLVTHITNRMFVRHARRSNRSGPRARRCIAMYYAAAMHRDAQLATVTVATRDNKAFTQS